MIQSQSKFAAGAILVVCLLVATAGGVLAAPADTEQETAAQSEQRPHAESAANSEESQAPDSKEHDRTARAMSDLQDIAEMLAEHLGMSIEELEMVLQGGPTALREPGIDSRAFRRAFMAVASQPGRRPEAQSGGDSAGVARTIAGRLDLSVDELVWAAMQGPEALRELGINPRALSRVLMVAEAQAMSAGQGPVAVGIRPAAMQDRMVQTEERMAARGRITRSSYVRDSREQNADRRLGHRDYAARMQPPLDSGDVLELTAHKLGIHPAELKAAFQESAMALALESIGMKPRFGAYTDKDFKGYKPEGETWEDKGYHGYGWPDKETWEDKGYHGYGWPDKETWDPEHSDYDEGESNEEEHAQDEAQGMPIYNLRAF